MTALVRVRRRNTALALAVGLVVLGLIPVAGVVAGTAITRSETAVKVTDDTLLQLPATPVAVVATLGQQGTMTSITAFALAPAGHGGTLVSIPVGARVRSKAAEAEGQGPQGGLRLADVYASEGIDAFSRELSGLLNTSLEAVEVLAVRDAAELLRRAGASVEVVGRFRSVVGAPTTTAELERWAGIGEVWSLLADQRQGVTEGARPLEVDLSTPSVEDLAIAVVQGPLAYHQFAVEPVLSISENPDLADLYDLDRSEVVLVMASVAPSAVIAASPSITVQVDSPFDFELTRRAVGYLLGVGANVLLVRTVETSAVGATEVRSSVRLSQAELEAFDAIFGEVDASDTAPVVEGIDVQIRLGTAFAVKEDDVVNNR